MSISATSKRVGGRFKSSPYSRALAASVRQGLQSHGSEAMMTLCREAETGVIVRWVKSLRPWSLMIDSEDIVKFFRSEVLRIERFAGGRQSQVKSKAVFINLVLLGLYLFRLPSNSIAEAT